MAKVDRNAARLDGLALPANAAAQRAGTVILTVASGTDRAQAAQTLARTMGRPLMRVDLDQLASRYIGETEKNLERVFSQAAASGALLFFDEADALFGKRSGVKDSHDRYANIEVGYLLQKIEAYSGIVVMASKGRQHIDPAFLRRLRHVVDLPWPPKGA